MVKSSVFGPSLLFLLLVVDFCSSLTPSTYLTEGDKGRLRAILTLTAPFSNYNLANIHHSLVGLNFLTNNNLNSVFPSKDKQDLCNHIKTSAVANAGGGYSLESIYFGSSSAKLLGCQVGSSAALTTFLESQLKEDITLTELYRAAITLQNLGKPLDSAKLSKLAQAVLKKDESLLSVGLAFQLASKLTGTENLAPFVERFGDVIVQADEVDGKFLQFEGGLGITAAIISGIYSLASVANKPTGLTQDQAIKFTNYFLSRKTVQTPKGSSELLDVLTMLTNNKYHIPVCISVHGSSALTPKNPVVSIKITNVLGKSLGRDLAVVAESSAWSGKKPFEPVQGDSTMFALNLLEKKPKRGSYDLSVTVSTAKPEPRMIGNANAPVKVSVLTEVEVSNPEIGVVDRDQVTSFKMSKLSYPNFSPKTIEADYQQKLVFKFSLRDKNADDTMTAHQVFAQFLHDETKQEIIFVAEPEVVGDSTVYKVDLNLAPRGKDFGFNSGKYVLSLIVGDPVIANSFMWKVASVKLSFPAGQGGSQSSPTAPWMKTHYGLKPEMKHQFREQGKRPPNVVSDTFSGLVLVPLLILFILWAKIGFNFGNFSFSLSALVFHASLGGIFLLFVCFYLHLNMFSTIKYLLGIGIITFLSGHSLLSKLAGQKQQK